MRTNLESHCGVWLHDLPYVLDQLRDAGTNFAGAYPNHHALRVALLWLLHSLFVRDGLLSTTTVSSRHFKGVGSIRAA
jgi:hypothetical protein